MFGRELQKLFYDYKYRKEKIFKELDKFDFEVFFMSIIAFSIILFLILVLIFPRLPLSTHLLIILSIIIVSFILFSIFREERIRKNFIEHLNSDEIFIKKIKDRCSGLKSMLIESGNYKYVENFVDKYLKGKEGEFLLTDAKCFIVNNSKTHWEDYYPIDKIEKLRLLISEKEKSIYLSTEQLILLIAWELKEREYKNFKDAILSNAHYKCQKNKKEIIREFLNIYGNSDYYLNYVYLLKRLLREMNIDFDEIYIFDEVILTKKEMDVEDLEKKLTNDFYHPYSFEEVTLLSGQEFEAFLKNLFEKMGYKVELTKPSSDQGADLILDKNGERTVVQAKRYSNKVNNKAVQEVVAAINYYKADKGLVVTTSEFTSAAVKLANANNISLMDGNKLKNLIEKYF